MESLPSFSLGDSESEGQSAPECDDNTSLDLDKSAQGIASSASSANNDIMINRATKRENLSVAERETLRAAMHALVVSGNVTPEIIMFYLQKCENSSVAERETLRAMIDALTESGKMTIEIAKAYGRFLSQNPLRAQYPDFVSETNRWNTTNDVSVKDVPTSQQSKQTPPLPVVYAGDHPVPKNPEDKALKNFKNKAYPTVVGYMESHGVPTELRGSGLPVDCMVSKHLEGERPVHYNYRAFKHGILSCSDKNCKARLKVTCEVEGFFYFLSCSDPALQSHSEACRYHGKDWAPKNRFE